MIIRWLIALIVAVLGATSAHAQCSTAFSKGALNTQVPADFPNQTSGQITPLTMQTFLPNVIASFQQYPGVNAQLGTTYTVALPDYGQLLTFNNSSAVSVTLSPASVTGFCPFAFYVSNLGAGNVTIRPQSGTIGGGTTLVITQDQSAMVFSDGTNWQALKFGAGGGGGSGTVDSGTINSLGYYATSGDTISGLTSCASGVYVTDGLDVPSCATTLPGGLTIPNANLTGTVMAPDAGTWSSSGITTTGLNASGTIMFGILSPTSLGASPTTVSGLTTNNSPNVSNDYIPYFSASAGSIEKATVGSISSAGVSGVSNLNGLIGALQIANGGAVNVSAVNATPTFLGITLQVAVTPPQGRLTLQSGTPVMTTTQANKATLFYDCFHGGNTVPYWNGTADTLDTIAACEVSTAMQAASTGVLNTAGVFDVWWEGNTHHNICIATNGSGGGWASDSGSNTSRGTGYSQLDFTTRPYITNKNTIASCYNGATNYGGSLTANKLTYLGTIFTTAAGQTTWQLGTQPTSGTGTAGLFGVFNAYNQIVVASSVWPGTSSWSVATGPRQINGSAAVQHSYVYGLNENSITSDIINVQTVTATAACQLGIGVDTTSAFTSMASDSFNQGSFSITTMATSIYSGNPGVGLHVVAGIEADPTAAICNGFGSNGTNSAGSLRIQLRM